MNLLQQALIVEKRNESARCAFMHDKISDALIDNKNFWKKMQKLGVLSTTDNAFHCFSPDELNTHFSSIYVFSLDDPTVSYNTISTASTDRFSFHLETVIDVILAVAHFKSQGRGIASRIQWWPKPYLCKRTHTRLHVHIHMNTYKYISTYVWVYVEYIF